MLSKLFKHEFKATARTFVVLYAGLLFLTILNKLSLLATQGTRITENPIWGMIQSFLMFLYVVMILAIVIVTIVIIIMRFYKNLLSDEGYLSFTLPVSVTQHLVSKLLVAAFWLFISILSVVASILILIWDADTAPMLNEAWSQLKIVFGTEGGGMFIISLIIYFFISIFANPLVYYTSMSIGQLFTRHKVIGSVAGYFLISFVNQIVGVISMLVISGNMVTMTSRDIINETVLLNDITKLIFNQSIVTVILAVVSFFVCKVLLEKKLNLE